MLCLFAKSDNDRLAHLALVALAESILDGGMASPFGVGAVYGSKHHQDLDQYVSQWMWPFWLPGGLSCIICGSVPHQDTGLSAASFEWRKKYIDESIEMQRVISDKTLAQDYVFIPVGGQETNSIKPFLAP